MNDLVYINTCVLNLLFVDDLLVGFSICMPFVKCYDANRDRINSLFHNTLAYIQKNCQFIYILALEYFWCDIQFLLNI